MALGIHDLGGVRREAQAFFAVLVGDETKDGGDFRQGRFAGGHEGVAARDGGDLGNPGTILLAVENDLVVVELHKIGDSIRQNARQKWVVGESGSRPQRENFAAEGRTMLILVRYDKSPTGWATLREIVQPAP